MCFIHEQIETQGSEITCPFHTSAMTRWQLHLALDICYFAINTINLNNGHQLYKISSFLPDKNWEYLYEIDLIEVKHYLEMCSPIIVLIFIHIGVYRMIPGIVYKVT